MYVMKGRGVIPAGMALAHSAVQGPLACGPERPTLDLVWWKMWSVLY